MPIGDAPEFRRSTALDDLVAARTALEARTSGPPVRPSLADRRSPVVLLVVTGAIGVLLSVSGAGLWLAAFSNTFLETNPDPAWQEAEAAGTFLFVCGAVLFVTSIVAGLVVGIRSLTRGAHRG